MEPFLLHNAAENVKSPAKQVLAGDYMFAML